MIAPYQSVAGAPDELQQDAGRNDRDGAGDAGDQAELRVRLDEFVVGAHGRRHERRLRHDVRLLQHERGEHEREQRERRRCSSPSGSSARRGRRPSSWITSRRPPATRSISGPISGAMTRNGAKLMTRNSITRERAASRSMLKNSESARATTIAASPPIISAWVIASRRNFDAGGLRPSPTTLRISPPARIYGTPSDRDQTRSGSGQTRSYL